MSDDKARPNRQLGRGLSALFADSDRDYAQIDNARPVKNVPISFLVPNRFQPRQNFDDTEIDSLVESIKACGILQPILVRRDRDNPNGYEIIAGERRWRAAQRAQLHDVPVIVKDLNDEQALEIALVENIQRQDLNPLEEAQGYQRLIREFNRTQEGLAQAVGKSRSHIANTLRLLNLPDKIRTLLAQGELTAGHARALLNSSDPEKLAKAVIRNGLNVRQTEALAQRLRGTAKETRPRSTVKKDADTIALEKDLSDLLGLKVSIRFLGEGGELVITYGTLDQLDEVLRRLAPDRAATPRVV